MNKNQAWEDVLLARSEERLTGTNYIEALFPDFFELHGDRYYGDDQAIVVGIATLNQTPVTIIAQEKGAQLDQKIKHNFGMAHPEGYRKALRLMKQAEKFHRPIICFVDTPGAFPGIGAEERGQAEAIAQNLSAMSRLRVPIISIIIGEAGSGGALALALADKVYMLDHAVYTVASPEAVASILWKDAKKAPEAAKLINLSATELYNRGVIDGVIPETDKPELMEKIYQLLLTELQKLKSMGVDDLVEQRYKKFRSINAQGRTGYEKN